MKKEIKREVEKTTAMEFFMEMSVPIEMLTEKNSIMEKWEKRFNK